MKGYRAAIVYHYKSICVIIDDRLKRTMDSFMKGFKRNIASLQQEGHMKIRQGKSPITFNGYSCLSLKFYSFKSVEYFAAPYFVLLWNLMCRSETVGKIHLKNITWEEDALVIHISKQKNDQEGERIFGRHLYANPLDPSVCPILALAVVIFSKRGSNRLFDGDRPQARFSDALNKALRNLSAAEIQLLGADPREVGIHSTRKGAPSYCLDLIDGPNPINVILRGGWSFGDDDVLKRYLFAGKGGDQLVGRSLSGLPINSEDFSLLPPHFPNDILNSLSEEDWSIILPDYETYPNCFKSTLPFLLASIVHHNDFLRATLSANGSLFMGGLYTRGYVNRLINLTITGHAYCPITNLKSTGVPSHVMQAQKMRGMQISVLKVSKGVRLLKKRSRKDRGIYKEIRSTLRRVEQRVEDLFGVDYQLQRNRINNINNDNVIINERNLNLIIENQERLFQELAELRNQRQDDRNERANVPENFQVPMPVAPVAPAENEHDENAVMDNFLLFHWGGKMHLVPDGFRFPVGNILSLWNSWYFGDRVSGISPLRQLGGSDVVRRDKTNLCRARRVFDEIEDIAIQDGLLRAGERMRSVGIRRSNEIAKVAYTKLYRRLYNIDENEDIARYRIGEVTYNAIYDKISRQNR